ncbi:MAG: TMEM165/GDT1 family protein [Pseudomonadales bacterium]
MDLKLFFTVFATVFLAELGDKTQLATMLYAAQEQTSLITIFFAASAALVVASAIGVLAGSVVSTYLDPRYISYFTGIGFCVIGVWIILTA